MWEVVRCEMNQTGVKAEVDVGLSTVFDGDEREPFGCLEADFALDGAFSAEDFYSPGE